MFLLGSVMVLESIVTCVGSSSGIGYCFGYWALSEEVAHLGKNIGHVVYLRIVQENFRNDNVQCAASIFINGDAIAQQNSFEE